ncbi:hypothetical protein D9615_008363 [Tricholomella constricta]|uniref:Uncharacterized protein n=1 Tax=Tricholomella constricta TaxID=117010 RepID=A0A8H5HDS3_9AGAR|nr:hypothetical protein D9615_008363 [Tricholomella constricta]
MAGAFSGHLINSFHAQQAGFAGPFGTQNTQLITSGAMSFNPQMHGTPAMGNQSMGDYSFSFGSPQPSLFNSELSEATTLKIASLQAKLNQKLGPEYISQRPGPGGGPKLTYAEGWKIINLANEVFGFNGWSSNVVSLTTDFIDYNEESRRYNVGTTAIVRVTLRDGVYHEDIGYGMVENSKSKGASLDKCKKEAVTDGLKRALRSFGNLLGNCLYDKSYTQEVVKIKVAPPKFDKSELHRRPEFEETKPNIAASTSTSAFTPSFASNPTHVNNYTNNNVTPTRPPARIAQQPTKVLSSLPSHMRSEASVAGPSSHVARTSSNNQTITSSSKAQPSVPTTSSTVPNSGRQSSVALPPPNIKPMASGASNAPQPPPVAAPLLQPEDTKNEEGDESFHFNSDDDAFLALVDLGEGDLGQPLLPETDLGRPLHDDDEGSDPSRSTDSISSGSGAAGQGHRRSSLSNSSSTRAQGSGMPPPPPPVQQGTGMLSKLLPHNKPQPLLHPPHRASNQFSSAPKPPVPQAANQNQCRPNHNAPSRIHQNQNQNQNHQPASATGGVTLKRPSTPSMGGFHFPPGVDPRAEQHKPPVAAQGQGSSSGIGSKRPLESISSSGNTRAGMGGITGVGGGGGGTGIRQAKREVFGRLDLGEGGDLKRVRHL